MMTGLIPEKEFSRRTFVKGGGVMLVGMSLTGGALAGKAQGAFDPFASPGPGNPNAVDSFLIIHPDNTASLLSGRIELGQGSTTALMTLAAEELDMDTSQFTTRFLDTGGATPSPNTGNTGGSSSITTGGRRPHGGRAGEARPAGSRPRARRGGSLTVSNGVVSGGGKTVTYGQLIGGKTFNVIYAGTTLFAGQSPSKPVQNYTQVAIARVARYDIPPIVTGTTTYVQNVRIPGMLHGRIVRPRGQGAYGDGTNPVPVSVDANSVAHLANVQVVHVGNFLGVVAPKEFDAIQAAAQLKVTWSTPPAISPVGNLWSGMRAFDSAGKAPARIAAAKGDVDSAMKTAAKTFAGTFTYHYQMHAPIGPNAALADVTPTGAIIWTHVKDGYGTSRPKIAAVLKLPINNVRIIYARASSFGGGARHVDTRSPRRSSPRPSAAGARPVHALGRARVGQLPSPATLWDVRGERRRERQARRARPHQHGHGGVLRDAGRVHDLRHHRHRAPDRERKRPGRHHLFRNAVRRPEHARSQQGTVPVLNNYFKTSTLRAPNAPQTCFACEQLIDQLAYLAGWTVPVPPEQHQLGNARHRRERRRAARTGPVAGGGTRSSRPARPSTGRRAWRTRSSRPGTSAPGRASPSAGSRTRRRRSRPRSRST
jgi:CO/xanthine dehydrogenase Mo-binding subunit